MQIITRKRNDQNYFYLHHTYRKNGKVMTREKYLGTVIPKDIESLKLELTAEIKEEINKKLEQIKANFQKEWKSYPISVKIRELQEIAIAFTYNTNAIEGSTITREEVREITQDKYSPNKSIRDVRETESHYQLFLSMLKKKEKITNKLFLGWHNQLFKETKKDISGKYRKYLVGVGTHIAPDWKDVKKLMNDLIRFVNQTKINPVELSGRAHYKFEKIHPFVDGNGRVGRFLMNYVLWRKGYPMIIIEYKKRKSY